MSIVPHAPANVTPEDAPPFKCAPGQRRLKRGEILRDGDQSHFWLPYSKKWLSGPTADAGQKLTGWRVKEGLVYTRSVVRRRATTKPKRLVKCSSSSRSNSSRS